MWPDIINGTLELLGAGFVALNVRQILIDKMVRGFHWAPCVFFAIWGWWNLFYYPHLDQWFSFAGGVALIAVETTWLVLIFRYWKCGR